MKNTNETTEEIHAKQEEISNESLRVPTIEQAPSPRDPELEAIPLEKIYEHKKVKRISDLKEVKISIPQSINKTK